MVVCRKTRTISKKEKFKAGDENQVVEAREGSEVFHQKWGQVLGGQVIRKKIRTVALVQVGMDGETGQGSEDHGEVVEDSGERHQLRSEV
ncbi:MAG: hypothetical protein ACRC4N_11680 [Gammaproteobacteria bacterium]